MPKIYSINIYVDFRYGGELGFLHTGGCFAINSHVDMFFQTVVLS